VLYQNYPNPFNPATKIRYNIPFIETHSGASAQKVLLKVYDVLGSEIATLVNEEKFPGVYEVEFNGSRLSSGVYFYRLTASNSGGRYTATKKFVLMK
ncbi:MAG: peptidase S8, partial [Ignavibacteria bacterium CG_4_9_14_3_um_filter_36_18]